MHASNPSTWKIESGGSRIEGQPLLHRELFRSARDTRDPVLRREKGKEKKEGGEPTLGLVYICSKRNNLHFKAQLLSACVEARTHIAFSLNMFYFHTSVHTL